MKVSKLDNESDIYTNCVYSDRINTVLIITYLDKTVKFKNINKNDTSNIQLNIKQRQFLQLEIDDKVIVRYDDSINTSYFSNNEHIEFIIRSNNGLTITIDEELLIERMLTELKDIPMYMNMEYFILYDNKSLIAECVTAINGDCISSNTNIKIIPSRTIELIKQPSILINNYSELSENIGGMKKELLQIFQRVFSTRLLDNNTCNDMAIKHVKGIMLHGPPGCGKTLIARELVNVMGCDAIYVAGPELINSYQGKSEENVRKLFSRAQRYPDQLSVIICDECDAIFKKRNEGTNNNTANNITNQFLTMIDGVKALNNILLICMTNRLELIDEAVLRPGRIELHIKVELPTLSDRVEIFNIHINKVNEKYKSTLNIPEYAKMTNNYTGSEIESIITNAKSKAISRILDFNDLENINTDNINITNEDIVQSINECNPSHGTKDKILELFKDNSYIHISDTIQNAYCYIMGALSTYDNEVISVIFIGNRTKDIMTALYVITSKFNDHVIVRITTKDVLNDTLSDLIIKALECEKSIIIIENIELVIKYNPLINNCDMTILQTIQDLMNRMVTTDTKVIITSKNEKLCQCLFPSVKRFELNITK